MQEHLPPVRRPSPQGGARAEPLSMQTEAEPLSFGGSQPMGLPGVSEGPPLGPYGLLGQVGSHSA